MKNIISGKIIIKAPASWQFWNRQQGYWTIRDSFKQQSVEIKGKARKMVSLILNYTFLCCCFADCSGWPVSGLPQNRRKYYWNTSSMEIRLWSMFDQTKYKTLGNFLLIPQFSLSWGHKAPFRHSFNALMSLRRDGIINLSEASCLLKEQNLKQASFTLPRFSCFFLLKNLYTEMAMSNIYYR